MHAGRQQAGTVATARPGHLRSFPNGPWCYGRRGRLATAGGASPAISQHLERISTESATGPSLVSLGCIWLARSGIWPRTRRSSHSVIGICPLLPCRSATGRFWLGSTMAFLLQGLSGRPCRRDGVAGSIASPPADHPACTAARLHLHIGHIVMAFLHYVALFYCLERVDSCFRRQ